MPVAVDELAIVSYPHPVLRTIAQPVPEVTDEVVAVARRMIDLMHEARGVGLAAPQVGLPWRLFVANPTGEPGDEDLVYINPQLSDPSPQTAPHEEGCLSLPDIRGQVTRPIGITIQATGIDGQPFALRSDELPARIWQHENDHLDGVLILDKMHRMDKLANRKLIKRLEQGG